MTFTLVFRVLLFCWKLKSKGASHILVLRNDHFVIIWKTNLFKPRLHQYPILRVFKATWSYTPGHEHQSRDLSHGKHHSYAITNCANRCSSKKGNIKYCLIECLPDPMGIVILKIAWIFFDISKLLTWSFLPFPCFWMKRISTRPQRMPVATQIMSTRPVVLFWSRQNTSTTH